MSIKIDGTSNKITKEDDNSNSVQVYENLYVNGQKVNPKGEESTSYVTISSNGVVDITPYATNTVFRIRVTDYRDMSNTKKEDGYYDVTNNNCDINITDLKEYTHLFVSISNPNPGGDDPEGPKEYSFSFGENVIIDPAKNYEKTIDFDFKENCKYKYFYSGNINCQYSRNLDFLKASIDIDSSSGGVEEGFINYEFKKESAGITFLVEVSVQEFAGYTFTPTNYILSNINLVIQETPNSTTSTTLSLHQPYTSDTSFMENLIVNNDALIQGSLIVNGYINDLKWYWDYVNFDAPVINLGAGFLAKLVDINIAVDENTISIPTLQLSPGSIYTTDSYNVSWKSDGNMIIESSKTISNISGLIQVLRYE